MKPHQYRQEPIGITLSRWMFCAVIILMAIQAPAIASIQNEDTGQGWHPTFDDEGNMEDPPQWVIEQNPGIMDYINSEGHLPPTEEDILLFDLDMCQSLINEWIETSSDATVHTAISDQSIFNDLKAEVKRWANKKISNYVATLDPSLGITVGSMIINTLECKACQMTYYQCLIEYQDGYYCKRYIGCNMIQPNPTSHIDATLPVSSSTYNLSGTLELEGSLRYRETELTTGSILRERCLHVDKRVATGFSLFINGKVESAIDDALDGNGDLCRGAGSDPSP